MEGLVFEFRMLSLAGMHDYHLVIHKEVNNFDTGRTLILMVFSTKHKSQPFTNPDDSTQQKARASARIRKRSKHRLLLVLVS